MTLSGRQSTANFFFVQVPSDEQLGKLLNNFKEGNTHMAMVVQANTENPDIDPFFELKVCWL